MFKEKTPQTERFAPTNATLISVGTTLNGDVTSDNDLRIDGTIKGNVICNAKIIIGESGYIEGNMDGQNADITGKVVGNLAIRDLLQLKNTGNIQGNIAAGKLQIDPSATFNGQCQMGAVANIVQMSGNEVQTEAK
jgi:cytoskeletal protein CcmA (bactofilin family)